MRLMNYNLAFVVDEFRLARALASEDPSDMRLGVLSVILRTSYYHIRFTLHRPYAAAAHDEPSPYPHPPITGHGHKAHNKAAAEAQAQAQAEHRARMAQSLDNAAAAADKLVSLVLQARPEALAAHSATHGGSRRSTSSSTAAHAARALAAHVHWGPFHCFSAAMFFSLQLVADPAQPGASLFRANVRRVLEMLRQASGRGVQVAEKAVSILEALRPLYGSGDDSEGGVPLS